MISNFLIILGSGIFAYTYGPIFYSEASFLFNKHSNMANVVVDNKVFPTVVDVDVEEEEDSSGVETLKAVNDKFAVVIPQINVNAPIVENVSTANYNEYMEALKLGVAHAQGTPFPGEMGNMFLFAHSSLNFWQLGPYATVFNLLNKLKEGDLVMLVKDNKTYIYKVKKTEIIAGWNTDPFYEEYDAPMLTMVTCYPPGTTVNRYIVTAVYIGSQD